jgi:hypothetical protein
VFRCHRSQQPPPEAKIVALAEVLDEDADILLAMVGKVSNKLQEGIRTVGWPPTNAKSKAHPLWCVSPARIATAATCSRDGRTTIQPELLVGQPCGAGVSPANRVPGNGKSSNPVWDVERNRTQN